MPALILLHGALGAASSLLRFGKALSARHEVHTIDFSGHGEAMWPDEAGFSIETFEADVLSFMDALNIPAAHIFGYSMGGFVGLRLASRLPEKILSLTTLATKIDWTPESCIKESAMLNADMMEAKVPKFVTALAAAHPRNGWRKLVEATQSMIGGMSSYRIMEEQYAAVNVPVRLLVGDCDRMVCIEETLTAYRALPNASLCVLPDTPHPLEHIDCELVASLVQGNMDKVAPYAF